MNTPAQVDLFMYNPESGELVSQVRGLTMAQAEAQAVHAILMDEYHVTMVESETGIVLATLTIPD